MIKMSKRLSQIYGMDIYTDRATFVGRVEDVILNLEKGEIMRLSLRPFRSTRLPSDEVKRILHSESVGYNDVLEVADIVLVQSTAIPKKREKLTMEE